MERRARSDLTRCRHRHRNLYSTREACKSERECRDHSRTREMTATRWHQFQFPLLCTTALVPPTTSRVPPTTSRLRTSLVQVSMSPNPSGARARSPGGRNQESVSADRRLAARLSSIVPSLTSKSALQYADDQADLQRVTMRPPNVIVNLVSSGREPPPPATHQASPIGKITHVGVSLRSKPSAGYSITSHSIDLPTVRVQDTSGKQHEVKGNCQELAARKKSCWCRRADVPNLRLAAGSVGRREGEIRAHLVRSITGLLRVSHIV